MFLLVSDRHVGARLGGHQHGVSIQISINLRKTFLRISSIRKIGVTWILARVFAYVPSFYFQILDLIYGTVLIFYFDLFWIAWHWKPAINKDENERFIYIRFRDRWQQLFFLIVKIFVYKRCFCYLNAENVEQKNCLFHQPIVLWLAY